MKLVELEHFKDGTSRTMWDKCENTYRLSIHKVLGFKYCPNYGDENKGGNIRTITNISKMSCGQIIPWVFVIERGIYETI